MILNKFNQWHLLWWRSWCLKVFRHSRVNRQARCSSLRKLLSKKPPQRAHQQVSCCLVAVLKKASWKQLLIQNSDPMMKLFGFKLPWRLCNETCFGQVSNACRLWKTARARSWCFAPNLDRDNLILSLTRFPSTWCFHHFDSCNPVQKRLWVSMCFHDINAIWKLIRSSCTFLFRQEFLPARARMKLLPNQRRRKLKGELFGSSEWVKWCEWKTHLC